MSKPIPEYSPKQEQDFLTENILGLTVTAVASCEEHGITLEFGDIWRVTIPPNVGIEWLKRKRQ